MSPKPTISLCCITAGPLKRVVAIAKLYRSVVDEIVCAVNDRFSTEEIAELKEVADRVIPCEMGRDFLQEHYRPWLYQQCSGDWIYTFDTDEVPSTSLLEALPLLVNTREVVTYITTVRWNFPDLAHWLDEYPWHPSWKLVMARNDPATLFIKGGVHEGVQPTEPCRYLDLPIYHLDCAVTSFEQRSAKVSFYDSLDGVQFDEEGRPISERYYLPERHAHLPQALTPTADLSLLESVVRSDPHERVLDRRDSTSNETRLTGAVTKDEILRYWPNHPFAESAYAAAITVHGPGRTPHRDLGKFAPGETRPTLVDIRNMGDEIWLRSSRNGIALASKWFADGMVTRDGPAYLEGPRSALTAPLHPGETLLQPLEIQAPDAPGRFQLVIDIVHEGVRWFGCGATLIVEVQ